jgi:hypothetical protein
LPLWLQKEFGKWTTYGGGGYGITPGPGNRNYWFFGWEIQRRITDRLVLGGELFHQTASTTGEPGEIGFPLGSKGTTGFNLGGAMISPKITISCSPRGVGFRTGRQRTNFRTTLKFKGFLRMRSDHRVDLRARHCIAAGSIDSIPKGLRREIFHHQEFVAHSPSDRAALRGSVRVRGRASGASHP